jgi:hypothetical protein
MENLDLGIYTLVVVGLFVGLGVGTFLQFRNMNSSKYTGNERSDDSDTFKAFISKAFD